jgi:hypothetical protein
MKINLLFAVCLLCVRIHASETITIIAPNNAGNSSNQGTGAPFGDPGDRLQAFYGAEEFSAIPEGGIITSVSFRLGNNQGSSVDVVVLRIEIRVSTSLTVSPFEVLTIKTTLERTKPWSFRPVHCIYSPILFKAEATRSA